MNRLLFLIIQLVFSVISFSWFSHSEYQRNLINPGNSQDENGPMKTEKNIPENVYSIFMRPKLEENTRKSWRARQYEYGPMWRR
ncbi:unnamed protein product [Caenorhabditis angaria]|uniref:Uncharacterized protein n=1 Tax=Caenorhabditis angaria TaxID=860376 RepID=A0A9P1ILP0_9PELO|nr:unnamed protein product [Caenorhabditis angaria]